MYKQPFILHNCTMYYRFLMYILKIGEKTKIYKKNGENFILQRDFWHSSFLWNFVNSLFL